MLDKLEGFLEKAKIYLVICMVMMLIGDAILAGHLYDEQGSLFGPNDAINKVVWLFLIVTGILAVVIVVLSVVLRIRQGDLYITVFDYLGTFLCVLFPVNTKSKKEIRQMLKQLGNEDEIVHSILWKRVTKGIHILNLMKTVFLFWFGSMILRVIIKSWLEMSAERILMTVLGSLFVIILYFWSLICGVGIRKKPDDVLSYCIQHELSFHTLNRDFYNSQRYGSGMYVGSEFVFIENGKGMQVIDKKEIVKCDVLRMGGWNPRRLFLSYYVLDIETTENHIMKYGISPVTFYKIRNVIESI